MQSFRGRYMDWSDFNAPTLATARFSPWRFRFYIALVAILGMSMAPLPLANQSKYLMVTLKNDADSPRFYLSEEDIKFEMWWPDELLTLDKCRSSKSLDAFLKYMPEEKLDTVCSIFMTPDYATQVAKGVEHQRTILAGFASILMIGLVLVVLKLSRMQRAQTLYNRWQARLACTAPTPSTTPSPADTASA